ncbi:MAG: DUF1552 domain-containing protein [Planctomycetota bacterium]
MSLHLHRRTVLRGLAGVMLPLPFLDAMRGVHGAAAVESPRRFCALYTANGMSLPKKQNKLDQWNWFPQETGKDFQFGNSTKPFEPFRDQLTFLGGLHHPNGLKADPHTCSDMWLTGAPLHDSSRRSYNGVSLDQVVARHTRQYCRQPSLVLSIDAGVGFLSRTGTISFNDEGKPIPAENNPRQVFERLFRSTKASLENQREALQRKVRVVDAVLENAQALSRQLGQSDRQKLDQYLTSLNEIETRLEASEKWLDVPIKPQDYSTLALDVTNESEPGDYYKTMFELIALAFDADITRSVSFMLNREDGMGISDTFPLKLGLRRTHHQLSHAGDPDGQLDFAKYDQFLAEQISAFAKRLSEYQDPQGSTLDNTIVLFGSGASTTHKPENLPTMILGGQQMGLQHGSYYRREKGHLCDLYLSILRALDIPEERFGDSTGSTLKPVA